MNVNNATKQFLLGCPLGETAKIPKYAPSYNTFI